MSNNKDTLQWLMDMKKASTMYYVKLKSDGAYSMIGFVMFTHQKEHAKKYTLDQAMRLIREIPSHVGTGELEQVE